MNSKEIISILDSFRAKTYFFTPHDPDIINIENIERLLRIVDFEFNPKLTNIHKLNEYAQKLIEIADVIYAIKTSDQELCGISVFYLRNRVSEYCHWTCMAVDLAGVCPGMCIRIQDVCINQYIIMI